jgi:curved DNA-binding protein CbpA
MKNYFSILGLPEQATSEDVKRAFRMLAKKWHPDVNKDPAAQRRFIEINEAYEFLIDDIRRVSHAQYWQTDQQAVDEELERRAAAYQDWYHDFQRQSSSRVNKDYERFSASGIFKVAMALSRAYNYIFLLFCALVIAGPIIGWRNKYLEDPEKAPPAWLLVFPIGLGLMFAFTGYYYLFILKSDKEE